tara:strand:+ start:3506 stop:3835 length:330 start_codon:yes stop_codon:yes gene_type:complete
MPISKREAGVVRVNGDRSRVRQYAVQRSQTNVGCTNKSPGEDDGAGYGDTDWENAFKVLSALISKQFVSSDLLRLTAYGLRDLVGEQVAKEFAIHAGLNRDKPTQDFMG